MIIICRKIYRDRIAYYGRGGDSHTCNKLVKCFCHGFLNPYKLQHIQTVSIPSVLLEEPHQKSSYEKLYPHMPFHPETGLILSGFTGWESWKQVAPLWGWASLGGLPGILSSESAFPQPLDQPVLPSNPEYLPASLLQRWEQNLETCKSILEKAGKQNDPQREAAPSETWPGLAWAPGPHTGLTSWPSLQVAFLIKGGASYWVSDYYGINYFTPSLL